MIKEFLLVIFIIFGFSYILKFTFDLDKLLFLLKKYFNSLKELKIEFSSINLSNKKYLQKKLDELSFNGILLLIYLLKFLPPYFILMIFLVNTNHFSSALISVFLPITPYIVLIKKINE